MFFYKFIILGESMIFIETFCSFNNKNVKYSFIYNIQNAFTYQYHIEMFCLFYTISVVTIFVGVNITKAKVNSNVAMYVMGVYVGVFVLIHLAMEIYNKRQSSS